MPSEVENANQQAVGVLKKVRASNGKLIANFYYVGSSNGTNAGIVLMLTAKDSKGQKTKATGKKLRAEIKGAKYAFGLIQVIDGKLTIIVHGGTASKGHMTTGFKKGLIEVPGLKSLLKAIFKTPSDVEITTEELENEDESPPVDTSDDPAESLSDVDMRELERLETEQDKLKDLSVEITTALSQEQELEINEYKRDLHEAQNNLQRLILGNGSATEIQKARIALSEMMDIGQSLHVSMNAPLSKELNEILNLSAKNMYNIHLRQFKPIINRAIDEAIDFGGSEVKRLLHSAENHALHVEYSQADSKIIMAEKKAHEVLHRLPLIHLFNQHRTKIEAAKSIKEKAPEASHLLEGSPALPWDDNAEKVSYGSEVKREWDALLDALHTKHWDVANHKLRMLIDYVGKLDGLLHEKREENEQFAEGSQKRLRAQMARLKNAKTEADQDEAARALADLKAAVLEEFQCANTAKSLGIDPAIEMNIPYDNEEDLQLAAEEGRSLTAQGKPLTCEEKFKRNDWFAIKDQFHSYPDKKNQYDQLVEAEKKLSNPKAKVDAQQQLETLQTELQDLVSPKFMLQLWKYRQKYVEELINTLRQTYPNLIAKASGSTDLESDIDITFATRESGDDVLAAKAFNSTIQKKFNKPPGRTFDVNIYIREYGPGIKEAFNIFTSLDPIEDGNLADSNNEQTQKLTQVDMDVATLLKQRRFLPQEQFDSLMSEVLKGMSKENKAVVEQQYMEAEAVYFETLRDKLDGIETKINKIIRDPESNAARISKAEEALELIATIRTVEDPKAFQRQLQQTVESLERDFPALTMETTDEMYLDRMSIVRENEASIRKLMKDDAEARKQYEAYKAKQDAIPEESRAEIPPFEEWRERKLEALRVQIKKDIITNIVFANEAYMSEGAIKHVVQTGQAKDKSDEDKLKIILEMPVANLVQSTNEQLADFFKDMAHSTADAEELRAQGKNDEAEQLEGEAYVHASKYVVRMLGAAYAVALKYEKDTSQQDITLQWFKNNIESSELSGLSEDSPLSAKIKALETRVDQFLYTLRKSGTIEQSIKSALAVQEVKTVFKCTSIQEFTNTFRLLGVELNTAVRQKDDFRAAQEVEHQAVDDYMLLREATATEKAENTLNACCANPLRLRRDALVESLELLTISKQEATSIAEGWKASLDALETYPESIDAASVQAALESWERSVDSLSNTIAKGALKRLHDQVSISFNLKLVAEEQGDDRLQQLLAKSKLSQKTAQFLFYKAIPNALSTWETAPAEEQDHNEIRQTRALQKENILTSCVQTSSELKTLMTELLAIKEDMTINSILQIIDEEITSLYNHRNRAISLQEDLRRKPLLPATEE